MNFKLHFREGLKHHAYLIEGAGDSVLQELSPLIEAHTKNNPDYRELNFSSVKMADTILIKTLDENKSISDNKKIFIITTQSILVEAQNALLKIFEEPKPNTHYFLILSDLDALLPTFRSRFYVIRETKNIEEKIAKDFMNMDKASRIGFIGELLSLEENEEKTEEDGDLPTQSKQTRALDFLNSLEKNLHYQFLNKKINLDPDLFDQIFKVRKYLRQPGSSAKSMLESLALSIPESI